MPGADLRAALLGLGSYTFPPPPRPDGCRSSRRRTAVRAHRPEPGRPLCGAASASGAYPTLDETYCLVSPGEPGSSVLCIVASMAVGHWSQGSHHRARARDECKRIGRARYRPESSRGRAAVPSSTRPAIGYRITDPRLQLTSGKLGHLKARRYSAAEGEDDLRRSAARRDRRIARSDGSPEGDVPAQAQQRPADTVSQVAGGEGTRSPGPLAVKPSCARVRLRRCTRPVHGKSGPWAPYVARPLG